MTVQVISAAIRALIILGGLFAIIRNLGIFLVGAVQGRQRKPWYNRPYLFRATAWAFTLFWLFGPYYSPYNVFQLTHDQSNVASFVLFLVAAASWLWVERISFLDGIPQQELPNGPAWAHRLGWEGHATLTYLIQLVCAAALGVLFVAFARTPLVWLVVVPFLIGTAGMSFWRFSCLTGEEHTIGEKLQHALGGRDAGPPHHVEG